MSITLPTSPVPAVRDLTANNILICGDFGIGKSGLLASTGYLLADPEDKLRAYECLRVKLSSWQDHLDFSKLIAAQKPKVPGIGLDSLNVSYSQCSAWTMANVTFQGNRLKHPSENTQIAYPRVTHEFITWLQGITLLGYHVVATCHVNIVEIKTKNAIRNRWVPAFVGGSAESTYGQVLRVFSVVGFMKLEEVERPATASKMGKTPVPDLRADASRIETTEKRVISFKQSDNWLANNKHGAFPDTVELTDNWEEDWSILKAAWGTGSGSHEAVEEEIKPKVPPTVVPAGTKAVLGVKRV